MAKGTIGTHWIRESRVEFRIITFLSLYIVLFGAKELDGEGVVRVCCPLGHGSVG